MDWSRYKALCDRPDVLSRWMLERTVELLERATPGPDDGLLEAMRAVLGSEPLARPVDHSGPPATDMFRARLDVAVVHATLAEIDGAAAEGWLTAMLGRRSAVGFVTAWREYALHVDGRTRTSDIDGERNRERPEQRLQDIGPGGTA